MRVPPQPRVYHLTHLANLPSIVQDGCLWSDARMRKARGSHTVIGMDKIKRRRSRNELSSHAGLHVGDCVPWFFCVQPPMLHAIHRGANADLAYDGGQVPIVYLAARQHRVLDWADAHQRRWAFTTSNAGAEQFDDFAERTQLDRLNWLAFKEASWIPSELKDDRQAELLIEQSVPWQLVEEIGVYSETLREQACDILSGIGGQPLVKVRRNWFV